MRGVFAAVALAGILILPGCLDGPGSSQSAADAKRIGQGGIGGGVKAPIQDNWAELLFIFGEGHDHKNFTHHRELTTPNFKVVGHNPLDTDYHGTPSGGYFCSDVSAKDGRALSVVHSWTSDVAFIISDVTDPMNPEKVGELAMANTHVYDLAISPDQRWVFLATSSSGAGADSGHDPTGTGLLPPIPPLLGEAPADAKRLQPGDITFRDACTGQTKALDGPEQGLPFASGIILVDIANPRNPQIADFRFYPAGGGHSIQVEEINGETVGLVSQTAPPGYFVFFKLTASPAGRTIMEPLSVYSFPSPPPAAVPVQVPRTPVGVPSGLHDGFIQKHPISNQVLAYLGTAGSVVIVDVTDMRNPVFLARWNEWSVFGEGAPANPFVHEALPIEGTWDGKHYTFIGEECGGRRPNTPTCLLAMLDTTDPANPTFVGGWTLPINFEWSGGLMYSLHYLAYVNRTLFATNYHGGLWAIDVSNPEAMRTMPSIGVFQPDFLPTEPVFTAAHQYNYAPVILDANPLPDGKLVVYDGTSGLYIVEFDATNPAPPPAPWPFPFNQ